MLNRYTSKTYLTSKGFVNLIHTNIAKRQFMLIQEFVGGISGSQQQFLFGVLNEKVILTLSNYTKNTIKITSLRLTYLGNKHPVFEDCLGGIPHRQRFVFPHQKTSGCSIREITRVCRRVSTVRLDKRRL